MLKGNNGGNGKPEDSPTGTTSSGPGRTDGGSREFTRKEKVKTVPTSPKKDGGGKTRKK